MTGARDVGRDGLQASRCLFIVFPAREASCFLTLERHLDPTGAHPTCHSCRVSHDKSMVRNVLGNHRTRSDQSIAPDCNATQDGGIGADRRTSFYERSPQLSHPRNLAARVRYVRKDHRWSAEHIVLEGHSFVYGNVVLNLHAIADQDIRSHHHVLPDLALFSYTGTF